MAKAAIKRSKTDRERDAERKRQKRAGDKLVIVPKCANKRRRTRLEKDDQAWLLYYFGKKSECPDPFWYDFTQQQVEMINGIRQAIRFGGDQAYAASRGEGKTTIAERLVLKYTLQGVVSFSVLFAATGGMAENSLDTIKTAIEENPLLAEDYPEVCIPVQALEGAPQRAGSQVVSGFRHDNGRPYEMARTKFSWCGQEIILPRVPGSPAAGAIIATRGLDAAVRGLKKRGKRPQLAVIDDPDTEDTARSEDQAKKLRDRIDRAIGGSGGQQRGIGRVLLTTLQSRIAVSYQLTDPQKSPTWKPKRFRFLITPPTDGAELWDEYVQLYLADVLLGDEFGRRAHAFYLANRALMDAGAVVANVNRFNGDILPDGTQREVCALQHYHNQVARIGPEAVATEYDNDPPEEMGPIESGLTATRIQKQVSGYQRKIVPPDCHLVTQGIDCGKVLLHWAVRAWRTDATSFTIDRDTTPVHGTTVGTDEGLDVALVRALKQRMAEIEENPYVHPDGEVVPVHLTLIDAGYRTHAVYQACRELGIGIMPAKGFGKSAGCIQANFHDQAKVTKDRIPGDGFFYSRVDDLIWFVAMDTDRWKAWEHDRWMTEPNRPGCTFLYGEPSDDPKRLSDDERGHMSYAKQIVAEIEVEEIVRSGVNRGALVRKWKNKSDKNHWLDASYMCDVAAAMKGVRLMQAKPPSVLRPATPKPVIEAERGDTPFLISAR